jgi:hypothetical protein
MFRACVKISYLYAIRKRPVGRTGIRPSSEIALAGLEKAHAPGSAAGLQPFICLFLFLRRYDGLARVAAFPDPGSCDELSAAAAALFGHGLL